MPVFTVPTEEEVAELAKKFVPVVEEIESIPHMILMHHLHARIKPAQPSAHFGHGRTWEMTWSIWPYSFWLPARINGRLEFDCSGGGTTFPPQFEYIHQFDNNFLRCWMDRRLAIGLFLAEEGQAFSYEAEPKLTGDRGEKIHFYFGATTIQANGKDEKQVAEGEWYKLSNIHFNRWYKASGDDGDDDHRAAFVLSVFRYLDKKTELFEKPNSNAAKKAQSQPVSSTIRSRSRPAEAVVSDTG
ncbi:Hypothetical protein D9617_15g043100 [Elsinoe fawcettii]|nr:Hypothetical protein D9617_15g043100 [Elsinoe fawcettii]